MGHADRGKWAEGVVHKWLDARSNASAHFTYHRYPDSRSAQGPLAAQPADFLVALGSPLPRQTPVAYHLEVKECANDRRLPKDKIRQYGKLKLFSLAGFRTAVLVYRSSVADWVVLKDADLFDHVLCPASFLMSELRSYPSHASALEGLFA